MVISAIGTELSWNDFFLREEKEEFFKEKTVVGMPKRTETRWREISPPQSVPRFPYDNVNPVSELVSLRPMKVDSDYWRVSSIVYGYITPA